MSARACVRERDVRLQLQGELELFDLAQQQNFSNHPGGQTLLGEILKAPEGAAEIWKSGDCGGLESGGPKCLGTLDLCTSEKLELCPTLGLTVSLLNLLTTLGRPEKQRNECTRTS